MANSDGENGESANPFQAPDVSGRAAVRRKSRHKVGASDFKQLAFQFEFFGVLALLFSWLLWQAFWIGAALLVVGAVLVVTGLGIGRFKPWAWYAGAVLLMPLLVVASLMAAWYGFVLRSVMALAVVVIVPLYCYYLFSTLFSSSGRCRYGEMVEIYVDMKRNRAERANQPQPPTDLGLDQTLGNFTDTVRDE